MAVTSQTILDGERLFIGKYTSISDTETAVLKVDVSTLAKNSFGYACNGVKINKIWSLTNGIGVDILWDAATDLISESIPAGSIYLMDYSSFGGIPNNSAGTGDINFSTVGPVDANSRYTIILECVKTYATS
jgi:hypothetical protein